MRFYHAKIDARSLKSGENYRALKNVIVIMITPYDPFGLNRMVYTIRAKCEEVPDMAYDDGARTLFLYTKGTEGNPSTELKQLLQYMQNTTPENATNKTLQTIHQMVEIVKQDEEVSLSYMKIFEREEIIFNQGIEHEKANTERERQRANAETNRANAEKNRADAEKERADAAEQEIQKLKEELEKLRATK